MCAHRWTNQLDRKRERKRERKERLRYVTLRCVTLSDVHLLHPRVDNKRRLVLALARRSPLHLNGLVVGTAAGHPGLAPQLRVQGEPVLAAGILRVPVPEEGLRVILLLLLLRLLISEFVSVLRVMMRLQRVRIVALLWYIWWRRGLQGLVIPPFITTAVLGVVVVVVVVVIPPLVSKITVIFFTGQELRLSIFTAHHVGLHD